MASNLEYGQKYEPLTDVQWVKYKPKHKLDALGELYPHDFKIPKMYVGKNIIHLPTMKTHGHTTITGSIEKCFWRFNNKKKAP